MYAATSDAPSPVMRLDGVAKRFGGIQALNGVDVVIPAGAVVALVGENGAGKSTLGKVIAGVHHPDAGRIFIDNVEVDLRSPRDALNYGIAMVAQELALVPEMRVADNVFLGFESRAHGYINSRSNRRRFEELQHSVGFTLDPDHRAGSLRVADQQKVEILRALARDARIIVMDEPTAALTRDEAGSLFAIVRRLTSQGTSFVFVSHFLEEVLDVADTVVVLKDGEHVRTAPAASETTESLVSSMIGNHVDLSMPDKADIALSAPVVLSVRGLTHSGVFDDVSFDVRAGEIVGLAGLMGSGRTEILRAIFGADRTRGKATVDGVPVRLKHPRWAMKHGIGMIPEDRKGQGLIMDRSIRDNITLASLPRHSPLGFISRRSEVKTTDQLSEKLDVRTLDHEAPVLALSGGNQQKVLFAKWLAFGARVLLIDEPTRGVDVGAKAAIHQLIADIAAQGVAVVLVSSEHEEVVGLANRVLVLRRGRIVVELAGHDLCEDQVAQSALGLVADQPRIPGNHRSVLESQEIRKGTI
ncbi:sugar ABC transporter ATP-binding protein [Leekyejoonella antrihumi]|uniref:Sugar ABC transporter ATP-binding protein n=1 Tax=Leekyejoonella antrihumi TaxID=1660198 RepID=A0A563DQM2_9MICO|nr:sugar ABC transporter ATP-binding protein [Leekyejoonella antrihumi]TWP32537.1 sugar ABC transporter ATP-binding protein [Leekyejoonella antrihumi]